RDGGDVADLAGQVTGHRVYRVGQVLPRAGHAPDIGLTAKNAFGSHFAGHARYFGGERTELIDQSVDGVLQFEDLAFDIDSDFLGKIAVGNRGSHFGNVTD